MNHRRVAASANRQLRRSARPERQTSARSVAVNRQPTSRRPLPPMRPAAAARPIQSAPALTIRCRRLPGVKPPLQDVSHLSAELRRLPCEITKLPLVNGREVKAFRLRDRGDFGLANGPDRVRQIGFAAPIAVATLMGQFDLLRHGNHVERRSGLARDLTRGRANIVVQHRIERVGRATPSFARLTSSAVRADAKSGLSVSVSSIASASVNPRWIVPGPIASNSFALAAPRGTGAGASSGSRSSAALAGWTVLLC